MITITNATCFQLSTAYYCIFNCILYAASKCHRRGALAHSSSRRRCNSRATFCKPRVAACCRLPLGSIGFPLSECVNLSYLSLNSVGKLWKVIGRMTLCVIPWLGWRGNHALFKPILGLGITVFWCLVRTTERWEEVKHLHKCPLDFAADIGNLRRNSEKQLWTPAVAAEEPIKLRQGSKVKLNIIITYQ